jgi:hypothetical protein
MHLVIGLRVKRPGLSVCCGRSRAQGLAFGFGVCDSGVGRVVTKLRTEGAAFQKRRERGEVAMLSLKT